MLLRMRSFGLLFLGLWTACSSPPPPNLVLITIDTLRADHLGCYGYERARTPNIDVFAGGAVRFTRATTVSNNTLPAHVSMITGLYPQTAGGPRNGFKLRGEIHTLAEQLQGAGYRTAAFVSASALASGLDVDQGFDRFDESFPVREMDQRQRRAETTVAAIRAWLAEEQQGPFFLWAHFFDPHYPYTPPPPLRHPLRRSLQRSRRRLHGAPPDGLGARSGAGAHHRGRPPTPRGPVRRRDRLPGPPAGPPPG
ncbi:MAG: hypothetical protein CL908_20105 [Deltaproteobacteria bacterium]|nr:hypothetical protein [Deltaproteobacteria bacterium]